MKRRRTRGDLPARLPGRVTVVGICAAGKSTLVPRLRAMGYEARSCSQEHSYVPDMWRRLSRPEALVYLDASLAVARRRRGVAYEPEYIAEQRRRLSHAREHCDVYILTDVLTPDEVAHDASAALKKRGIARSQDGPCFDTP